MTCEDCGRRFDRPGLFDCDDQRHAKPTKAQRIAAAIERDLADRRGIGQEWQSIDEETQVAIRDAWAKLIEKELRR